MLFEIKSRFDGHVLFSLDCASLKVCVEAGVKAGANLGCADLGYANLGYANLRCADLGYANLGYANLRYADLRCADLGYANLGYANLRCANLRCADLGYANLRCANLSWSSHDLLAEILRCEAGNDIRRRSFAGLILISRDWCWGTWLKLEVTAEVRWAASVLVKWIKPENTGEHIDAIKRLAAEVTEPTP